MLRWMGIRVFAIVCAVLNNSLAASSATPSASGRRPNIVLIMADDMGFSDLGCYGSEIATPHLDRLAADGLRFTQFYNNARCCPTRAALLTGLYSHQAGMGGMVSTAKHQNRTPSYIGYLNDHCVTIAEVLRSAGYRTYMSGKWHVGEERPHWPTDRGFDHYFGLISGASNYFYPDPERTMAHDDQIFKPNNPKFYMTDAFGNAAVTFIKEHIASKSKQPYFLYLAFTSPHWPLHAWPEDIAKYRGKYNDGWDALRKRRYEKMIELGIVDRNWPLSPRAPSAPAWDSLSDAEKDDLDLRMAVYAAQIDRMDQNIGKLLAAIRKTGRQNNTLIMFLADNGGCAEGINRSKKKNVVLGGRTSFASYGLPWANASNTPFRLYKHFVHEGGISTPFIAHWPAVIRKGGNLTPQVGHIIDVMATCADVAGATYPETFREQAITPLEGKSLLPIFKGETRPAEVHYWEHEGNRAVRQSDWKLVGLSNQPWELYDLKADRTEVNNLADKHPDRVKELAKLYDTWAKEVGVKAESRKGH